jgi:hypothetical protein
MMPCDLGFPITEIRNFNTQPSSRTMPTVTQLLNAQGFAKGVGPNFYHPGDNYPHIHIGVQNAFAIVADLSAARATITFTVVSFGGNRANINIYQANTPGYALRVIGGQNCCVITNIDHKTLVEQRLAQFPQGFTIHLNQTLGAGLDL